MADFSRIAKKKPLQFASTLSLLQSQPPFSAPYRGKQRKKEPRTKKSFADRRNIVVEEEAQIKLQPQLLLHVVVVRKLEEWMDVQVSSGSIWHGKGGVGVRFQRKKEQTLQQQQQHDFINWENLALGSSRRAERLVGGKGEEKRKGKLDICCCCCCLLWTSSGEFFFPGTSGLLHILIYYSTQFSPLPLVILNVLAPSSTDHSPLQLLAKDCDILSTTFPPSIRFSYRKHRMLVPGRMRVCCCDEDDVGRRPPL